MAASLQPKGASSSFLLQMDARLNYDIQSTRAAIFAVTRDQLMPIVDGKTLAEVDKVEHSVETSSYSACNSMWVATSPGCRRGGL